jgi:osmotically-inducible protein OsmY
MAQYFVKVIKLNFALLILGCAFVAATGCTHMSNTDVASSSSTTDTNALMIQGQASSSDSDNTGKNDRDRSGNTLTAGDQGNSPEDRDLTQKIRHSLIANTDYSTTAKNIKIITVNGRVTLRGPVNSEAEKSGVLALARNIAGDGNVDDQLEIKSNQ